MKKTRVVLCLFLAFVLCFTMGTTIVSAESFSMENAPLITLGEPFAIDVKKTTESQTEADEVYVGKFIPEETGSSKLTFDTVFDPGQTSEDQPALVAFVLATGEEDDESGGITMCFSSKGMSDEDREMMEDLFFGYISFDDPTFTAELDKGKTYYLAAALQGTESYTTNVTISTHTHDLHKVKERAGYETEDGFDYFYSGGLYYTCKDKQCAYYEELEYYPAVDTIKLSSNKFVYTGTAKKPTVTIKNIEGGKLKKGTDYTVSYSNNTKIGKGKAIITFKGNYEGKYTKTFKINPAKVTGLTLKSTNSKQFKATYKKVIGGVKYQVVYRVKGTSTWKKVTTTNTYKTVKSLKGGKTYQVKVRAFKKVNSTTYYGKYSKIVTIKVKK